MPNVTADRLLKRERRT